MGKVTTVCRQCRRRVIVGRYCSCLGLVWIDAFDLSEDLREVSRVEHGRFAKHDCPEDGVFQLPNVAGPVVAFQKRERSSRYAGDPV